MHQHIALYDGAILNAASRHKKTGSNEIFSTLPIFVSLTCNLQL